MTNLESLAPLVPFWDALDETQRGEALAGLYVSEYQKDSFVHGYETDCLGMLVLLDGHMRASIVSEEGREITLFNLRQGDVSVLTASCVIASITFETQIVAEEDTRVLILRAPVLAKLAASSAAVECYLYKLATERFSEVMWAMQQMLFMGVDKRLAVYLYDEYARTGELVVRATHEQIARNIGSAREVVTRMLSRFADDGIAQLGRGTIKLTDLAKLKKLAM